MTSVFRPRFALRTLLLALGVVGALFGSLALQMRRAASQREAALMIWARGGDVLYAYELDESGARKVTAESGVPAWLRTLLGRDFFYAATSVHCSNPAFDDEEAVGLRGFRGARFLYLRNSGIGNETLQYISRLPDLEVLYLDGTKIDNRGLTYVDTMPNLRVLGLHRTRISGKAIARLAAAFPKLQSLDLSATNTRDADLWRLQGLTNLRALRLCLTHMTDEGVDHLAKTTDLRNLSLRGTAVTDAALNRLVSMSNLEYLDVRNTHVTDEGVKSFQDVLPGCTVDWGNQEGDDYEFNTLRDYLQGNAD
jgi:hypothetical protein